MFTQVSLGYWDDNTFGAYDIKANVDRMSIAPAKPFNFVRKEPNLSATRVTISLF